MIGGFVQGIYEGIEEDFYDAAIKSPNPLSRAYHLHRYAKIREYIGERGLEKGRILDVGCGSCAWNTDKWKVVGFDLSRKLLEKGIGEGRLSSIAVGNLKEGLPFKNSSFDTVVLSEVLEHLENPAEKLHEIARVLRKGGRIIVTVPFGHVLGLWGPLFALQCAYMGHVRGMEYYRKKCGHINSFDEKSLAKLLVSCGFSVEKMEPWILFNLCALARKN